MYNVLNINAQTLYLSRTPRRLKTSCESTPERTVLPQRKTKFKIPFQFPDTQRPLDLNSATKIQIIYDFYVR